MKHAFNCVLHDGIVSIPVYFDDNGVYITTIHAKCLKYLNGGFVQGNEIYITDIPHTNVKVINKGSNREMMLLLKSISDKIIVNNLLKEL